MKAIDKSKSFKQSWLVLLMVFTLLVLSLLTGKPVNAQNESFIFAAGGDHGSPGSSDTKSSLEAIVNSGAEFYLALGDFSYQEFASEPTDGTTPSPWCSGSDPDNNIKLTIGDDFPFQLIVGNHEDDDFVDGYVNNMSLCLPDRMNSTGVYGAEYYFDYPQASPLMRVIMIGAGNDVEGEKYDYLDGNAHSTWLINAIDSARASEIPWVVVGMHKNCLTMGNKSCEIEEYLMDLLIEKRVDLVVQGHDHTYQRTKQLSCANADSYDSSCVADDGSDDEYQQGLGAVFIVNGNFGGGGFTPVECNDSERHYFARAMGGDGQVWDGQSCTEHRVGRGITAFTVTENRLDAQFIMSQEVRGNGDLFTDTFSILRDGGTTPPGEPTSFQPSAPYHASFFYLWYQNPNTDASWSYWHDSGNSPPDTWFSYYIPNPNPLVFDPSTELYSTNNYDIFKWQLEKLAEAKQEVAIASWWGPSRKEDFALDNILNDFMHRADNPYPNLRWAIYYEDEGFDDPSVNTIVADLQHINQNFAQSPYFLKIDGKPVIFVYGGSGEGTGTMTQRWSQANQQLNNNFYIILKVFSGYQSDPFQPDWWHQYAPANRYSEHSPYSVYVSPGFWLDDGSDERLPRDLAEFESVVQDLVASEVAWKLVQTWNEWGEGTSVEPGQEVMLSSGNEVIDPNGVPFDNLYVDILNRYLPELEQGTGNFIPPTPPPLLDTPTLVSPENNPPPMTNNKPTFRWQSVQDANRYELQLDTSDPPASTVQNSSSRQYMPPSGLLMTTYYWRVRAFDQADNPSGWSETRSLSFVPNNNALPILNRYETNTPSLTWNLVTWASGYEMQIDNNSNFTEPEYLVIIESGNTLAHTPTTPLSDGVWYWRMRARRDDGTWGNWSSTDTFAIVVP